jgi:hypothetical protein
MSDRVELTDAAFKLFASAAPGSPSSCPRNGQESRISRDFSVPVFDRNS